MRKFCRIVSIKGSSPPSDIQYQYINMASRKSKTAIVSGACSGIGLALTKHMLAKEDVQWRVVLADIRPEAWESVSSSLDGTRTKYVKTDVASWEDDAALFKEAYNWETPGFPTRRIDFFAANAGTGDKEFVLQPFDLDEEPQKPNTVCMDVNITSVLYGLKLFIHYARKTKRDLASSPGEFKSFNPKVVITASCVGQYPFPIAPQYTASKHACVGFTRSVGEPLLRHENIAVNCIMPAFVATPIIPGRLNELWPKEYITPLSTMCRAYDELIDVDGKVKQDGKSDGKNGVLKTAQSVECVVERLFYRTHVPPADESQAFLLRESTEDGLWGTAIKEAAAQRAGMGGLST